jgi:hypothetical protein
MASDVSSSIQFSSGGVDQIGGRPSTRKGMMNISSVSHSPAVAIPARLTTSTVSAAALKAATGDGDGRTGAAALNDRDAAAQSARRGAVDIKA